MNPFQHSTQLQQMLERLSQGDPLVRDALIQRAFERLRLLARRMLRQNRDLRAAVETDDVLQGAAVRLHRALPEVQPLTVRRFFALAAVEIRRELLDLVRQFLGEGGWKARQVIFLGGADTSEFHPLLDAQEDPVTDEPASLEEWTRFHEAVAALPEEEREVFDLVWYHAHSQPEVAELLNISTRTVKRRWRSAQVLLHQTLHGQGPSA
jgi:RNA polymerase sigma-70 factor (ECF subfamily)